MSSKDIKTINILYIEDDLPYVGLILEYLKRAVNTKFNVTQTCTLQEGLDYLKNKCFTNDECNVDLILLDLILPDSRGVDTYKSVVEHCKFLPIVIMSAHKDLALECVQLGAQDYLVKPFFTGESLTRVLRYSYERGRLEREKIKAEKKYKEVLNHTPISFYNYELKEDNKLHLIGFNPSAEKMLKEDRKSCLGKCIKKIFPELDTEIPDIYKNVIKTGKPFSEIRKYKNKNNEAVFFKVHAFKTSHNTMSSSFEDVTKEINAENKYKSLIEATNAGVFEIHFSDMKLKYVNKVLCNMLGYTKEEMLSMRADKFLTPNSTKAAFGRLAALEYGLYINRTQEYQGLTKEGNLIWLLLTSEYLEKDDGTIYGANIVVIDITESKRIKEEEGKKEEKLFDDLEDRLYEWKKELSADCHQRKKDLMDIGQSLKNLNIHTEVL